MASSKKAKTGNESYYRVIDGAKYDRALLEAVEGAAADGQVSLAEARRLWKDQVEDGNVVTDVERATVEYALNTYTFTAKARTFLTAYLAVGKHTSQHKVVDGVKYDRALLESAQKAAADGQVSYPEAKQLLEDASDGKGLTRTGKATLEYVLNTLKFTDKARKFLEGELQIAKPASPEKTQNNDDEEAKDVKTIEPPKPPEPPEDGGKEPRVLETPDEVQELLSGKRVLHVKGFGGGFGECPEGLDDVQRRQDEAAVVAISRFRPDFLVVDGDPFKDGFQRYVKAYADRQAASGLAVPELIWVKNVRGGSPTPEERDKRLGQAREWADQGLRVVVSWLPEAAISHGVDRLFGAGCWETLEGQKFNFRGAVRLLEADEPGRPEWLRGLTSTAPGREMYKAIEAVEGRADKQYFEKCSFENAAKGSAIYQHLRGAGREPAAQGAVSFGGGESVLLEFATLYLSPGSGFDASQAALFPFSRGKPNDPALPAHEGHAFKSDV